MMAESSGQPSGAARRRRERRLRSMLRDEQQTVRMALAAALHHSAGPKEKVEMQQYGAPRGQKTAARAGEEVEHATHYGPRAQETPPPGVRPGSLAEPGPQRSDRSLRRSSGQTPLLGVPSLADAPAEAIDGRTLRYLLKANIARKKFEEEEEEEKRYQERAAESRRREKALLDHAASLQNRKRKKRKKKLPRSGCRRPCDRQRQVPAALRVLRVPRQNGGHSCIATETGTHSLLLGPGAVLGQGCCARVAQRQVYGQTVQKTVLVPQFAVHRRSTSLRAAEANPHGPACSESHRDSTVAVGQMVDALVVQVVPCPTGAHGSDSAENCGNAAVAARRFDISVVVQRQIPMVLFRTIEIPVATAAVVTSCSSSANCSSSAAPMCCGGVCVAMSCGGTYFSPDGAYDFAWDSVKPTKGTYTINYIQYP